MPALDGSVALEHRYVELGEGVTIHVADAGPADGSAVMLVHGFPENWWEWHELIGPLAADGYRVLCPDLRGAGWSSAPRSRYLRPRWPRISRRVLDKLGVEKVKLVAHDWGGPAAFIMMLRHPEKVTGFFGLNTVAPWVKFDLAAVRDIWRFWYQVPMFVARHRSPGDQRSQLAVSPYAGFMGRRRVLVARGQRPVVRRMHAPARTRGGRFALVSQFSDQGDAAAGCAASTTDVRVEVPVRWLTGTEDPVITPRTLLDGYADHISDFEVELVDWCRPLDRCAATRSGTGSIASVSETLSYSTPIVTSVDLMNTVAG